MKPRLSVQVMQTDGRQSKSLTHAACAIMAIVLPATLLAPVKQHADASTLQATHDTRQQWQAEVDQGAKSAAAEAVTEAVWVAAEGLLQQWS